MKIESLKKYGQWKKKPKKKLNRNNFGLNWYGREKTEPNMVGSNRFSVQFGSKTWKKIILI
jgi:hypothetical protein